jgi:prophage regulatory protein
MQETFLSDKDLAARWGVSRPTVWRWAKEQPDFPQVVKLTPGCARWRLSHIEAWESARAGAAA